MKWKGARQMASPKLTGIVKQCILENRMLFLKAKNST
jgi:hypothetical protein